MLVAEAHICCICSAACDTFAKCEACSARSGIGLLADFFSADPNVAEVPKPEVTAMQNW
jgi:hypothetical protein